MTRTVDRSARRRAVGAALLRLVARAGLEAVSVRTVAAEAGCSPGAVQKYFATKDEMLAFAFDLAAERAAERLEAVDPRGPLHEVVERWIVATLPLDDARRSEARIWLEFLARAASHAPFARAQAEIDVAVRAALAGHLEEAQRSGALDRDVDAHAAAHALVAISDGLAAQLLYSEAGSTDPADEGEKALVALATTIRRLLPPPHSPQRS